jgi:hypothetical protein
VLKQLEKVEQTNRNVKLFVAIVTADLVVLTPNWCAHSERVASIAAVYQNIKSTFIDDG